MPGEACFKQDLCTDMLGFSLQATLGCAAKDRQALEQLCRHITRLALTNERVQFSATGRVVLKGRSRPPGATAPRTW
ncbi:MAG: hypothetical protein WA210_23035 [Burkholderiaceae bacterium]